MTVKATTILGRLGDITWVWDESADEMMEQLIQKKMDEGYTFWLIEPRMGGILPPNRVELDSARAALRHRAVAMRDVDFVKLVCQESPPKGVTVVRTPDKPAKSVRRAKTAKEASAGETVAVRAARGG